MTTLHSETALGACVSAYAFDPDVNDFHFEFENRFQMAVELVMHGTMPTSADHLGAHESFQVFMEHIVAYSESQFDTACRYGLRQQVSGYPLNVAVVCNLASEVRRLLRARTDNISWQERRTLFLLAEQDCHCEDGSISRSSRSTLRRLIRAATAPWKPSSHGLFPEGLRLKVQTVMLVVNRLIQLSSDASREVVVPGKNTPLMPLEMWILILSFVQRCDSGTNM